MSAPTPYEPHHVHVTPCPHPYCDDGYVCPDSNGPTLNSPPDVLCPDCDGVGHMEMEDCDCDECAARWPEWFAANVEAPRGWEVG